MGYKHWTSEEISYLEENWSNKTIKSISKHLNRGITGVKIKANRLGLGPHLEQQEYMAFSELLNTLGSGSSYSYLSKKWSKAGLRIIEKVRVKGKIKVIYINDFWKWAENNKQLVNFSKLEKNILGPEPSWVEEKRKADRSSSSKKYPNRKWTKYEENLLIQKTKSYRYTYKDLSREFKRTEGAIKMKLQNLGVFYRPVPLDNKIKWTDKENNLMIELYQNGYDTQAIAIKLNKAQSSINNRLRVRGL